MGILKNVIRMNTIWMLPTFILISSVDCRLSKCHDKLLENCFCGQQFIDVSSQFVVNCTNTGFNNTDMLMALPEETNMLIFTGNHLHTLPSNIFGEDADLDALKVIDMSNNGIREIKGKTFHHVSNVERLILNHNNISIAEENDKNLHHPRVFSNFDNLQELHLTNAFADNTDATLADDLHDIFVNSNLTKLYKLHLEQNEIKNFKDEMVFCDLPNLHDLHLGDNNIPNLNFNVTCLKKLRYLDLESNNITKFTQKELDTFDRLASQANRRDDLLLEVVGNPFKCDSNIKNFYQWTQSTKVKIRHVDSLKCIQLKHGSRYFVSVKPLVEQKSARISQALSVLLGILVSILLTLLAVYTYLKKDSLRSTVSPFFEAITRKVQYSTIESQDV